MSFVVSGVFYRNGRKFDDLNHQHSNISAINSTKSGFLQPFYSCFVETRQGMTLYCFFMKRFILLVLRSPVSREMILQSFQWFNVFMRTLLSVTLKHYSARKKRSQVCNQAF